MKTYTAKIWRVSIRGFPGRAIEIKICAIIPFFGHILPIMGFSNRKKAGKSCFPASCRTRIRTRTNRTKTCCATITPYDNRLCPQGACKDTQSRLLGNEQIVVFLASLKHDIPAVNQVGLGKDA